MTCLALCSSPGPGVTLEGIAEIPTVQIVVTQVIMSTPVGPGTSGHWLGHRTGCPTPNSKGTPEALLMKPTPSPLGIPDALLDRIACSSSDLCVHFLQLYIFFPASTRLCGVHAGGLHATRGWHQAILQLLEEDPGHQGPTCRGQEPPAALTPIGERPVGTGAGCDSRSPQPGGKAQQEMSHTAVPEKQEAAISTGSASCQNCTHAHTRVQMWREPECPAGSENFAQ